MNGDDKEDMDGDDKKDGTRHGILWGKNAIDGDNKDDGRRLQRRWVATTKNMERDMAFFGEECHGW